jgi:hypothetical protein
MSIYVRLRVQAATCEGKFNPIHMAEREVRER